MKRLDIKIVDLPKISDPRGNLTFAEAQSVVPFDIKRAYWVYDVPSGESRGGHAHKRLRQFVIALSGSFQSSTNSDEYRFISNILRTLETHRNRIYNHPRRNVLMPEPSTRHLLRNHPAFARY